MEPCGPFVAAVERVIAGGTAPPELEFAMEVETVAQRYHVLPHVVLREAPVWTFRHVRLMQMIEARQQVRAAEVDAETFQGWDE